MMIVIQVIGGIILFCPLLVLIGAFIIFRKMRMKKRFALGFAADLMTFVLFFSVPLAFHSAVGQSYVSILLSIMLLIGLILTFMEWRTKKEIDVPILLKKIWRIYFVVLSMLYVIACVVGIVLNVWDYLATP